MSQKADDTAAVQSAINACASGGVTLLPANGTFLCLALALPSDASHTALQIDGILRFNDDMSKWSPKMDHPYQLVLAGDNIVLTGKGTVDGQGAAWWPCAKAGCWRPGLVYSHDVDSLLINGGLTFENSPNHNLELYASPFEVTNISIFAPPSTDVKLESHNTGTIHVSECDGAGRIRTEEDVFHLGIYH